MTAIISRLNCVVRIGLILCLNAISDARADSDADIKLNENAAAFASQLIRHGHLVADGKGGWHEDKPSPAVENDFIRLHGFAEYAKWHLGVDERYAANTKRRYKFPYGDFTNVHRCGLLAVKARAAEHKHRDIEGAAARLLGMIASGR
ncbi:MAG: hypothetical protein ACM3NN_09955 [Nitrospirota bacterium]